MSIFAGKAFVRKFPAGKAQTGRPTTMVLLLVDGDVDQLTDEALHGVHIVGHGHYLEMTIETVQKTEKFRGHRADKIITTM